MKRKIWLFQIPIIVLSVLAFWVTLQAEQGTLDNRFLRERLYPHLRAVSGKFTDWKFRFRGPRASQQKIVIVGIDEASLEALGRWPWPRDIIGYLVERIFQSGAKVVGIDVVFPEADRRVPEELVALLKKKNLSSLIKDFETDPKFANTIARYKDRLVLGWTSENTCQPGYVPFEECPVTQPEAIEAQSPLLPKFALSEFHLARPFAPQTVPLMSFVTAIENLPDFSQAAEHAGFFNAWPDSDGVVRKTSLILFGNSKPYPSLSLEMARVGLREKLALKLNINQKVESLAFAKSGKKIPVTPLGTVEINFKGPAESYPYLSAIEVMREKEQLNTGLYRQLASSRSEVLKDAYVLIGTTALGLYDMRAFPFDSNVPGVEGHATILDNILNGDALIPSSAHNGMIWIFLLMGIGALLFAYFSDRMDAVPGLIIFIVTFTGVGILDFQILFSKNINWNLGFFYIELFAIFVFTIAIKYILEERNKKFIKGAFSKYVAPAIVDSILKDPGKLSLGGEKKNLTILFSDIRGFTGFSEKLDPKDLAAFLNDYLGKMTEIVFKYQGTLDKYIGDAVMAFWGAPIEEKQHSWLACQAAIEMQRVLHQERDRYLKDYGVMVNVGIGVHTGAVNVGNMGSDKIFEYTVIGDHVNLTSRLEGLTKNYDTPILTTRATLDQIEATGAKIPPHRVLDFVKVKGKKLPVEIVQIFDNEIAKEGIELFDQARRHYLQRNWPMAIETFRKANSYFQKSPDQQDEPCQIFVERCEQFTKTAPSADWDGSWEMLTK